MGEDLYPYYAEELRHFRDNAATFRKNNPRLAGRLGLGDAGSFDPHVEQLLQGFALIAARLHRRLDDGFGDMAESLIEALYPHLIRPIPSRTIVAAKPIRQHAAGSAPISLPRGTELLSAPLRGGSEMLGLTCRFRTIFDTWLTDVEITGVRLERREGRLGGSGDSVANARLSIRLRRPGGFEGLGLSHLRFHIAGEARVAHTLYELLAGSCVATRVRAFGKDGSGSEVTLTPVGFEEDEALLEAVPKCFEGYRLLLEYFAFPEKFLFFDIGNLKSAVAGIGEEMEVVVDIGDASDGALVGSIARMVGTDTLRLGCVPVVNLFPINAEPIRLTYERASYPVVVDQRRPQGYEVYRVAGVALVGQGERLDRHEIPPLFARHHPFRRVSGDGGAIDDSRRETFWSATHDVDADGIAGTDITLVNRLFNAEVPTDGIMLPRVLATNRDAPLLLQASTDDKQGEFVGTTDAGGITARWLTPPAAPIRFVRGGRARWQLVSHLAANRLSLVDGGAERLRGLLSVYNFPEDCGDAHLAAEIRRKISAIVDVASRSSLEAVGSGARRGLIEGTAIALEFDETGIISGDIYLFSAVLDRFIASFAAVNSFTRLEVRSRQRERAVGTWKPRVGLRPLV